MEPPHATLGERPGLSCHCPTTKRPTTQAGGGERLMKRATSESQAHRPLAVKAIATALTVTALATVALVLAGARPAFAEGPLIRSVPEHAVPATEVPPLAPVTVERGPRTRWPHVTSLHATPAAPNRIRSRPPPGRRGHAGSLASDPHAVFQAAGMGSTSSPSSTTQGVIPESRTS